MIPGTLATRAAEADRTAAADAVAAMRPALHDLLGERLSDNFVVRRQHCDTSTWIVPQPPDLVAYPASEGEVQAIVRLCGVAHVPVVPYGAGTSLEGQINAPYGGVSLDLGRMNRIVSVDGEDLTCTVEAGVTRLQLNAHLRDVGLFFPVDPGADATLGGMAATRASGTTSLRYGTMREQVLRLRAVMADGSVMDCGSRARKSAAGYDLTHLMVGSAGTLGVITELSLKLHGLPEAVIVAICPFPDTTSACRAVTTATQMGLPLARAELLDQMQMAMCNAHFRLGLEECPTLLIELHGSPAGVEHVLKGFRAVSEEFGGGALAFAEHPEDRDRLWKVRHGVSSACRAWRPQATFVGTDACVPLSALADCVDATRRDLNDHSLTGSILGHVGDGNFHVALLLDMENPDEVIRGKEFVLRLARRAIAVGGTCTGEHGIGQGKMHLLEEEAPTALPLMRAIKRALDPGNIMNPGKIFRLEEEARN